MDEALEQIKNSAEEANRIIQETVTIIGRWTKQNEEYKNLLKNLHDTGTVRDIEQGV